MMKSLQWQGSSQPPDHSNLGPRIKHPYLPLLFSSYLFIYLAYIY